MQQHINFAILALITTLVILAVFQIGRVISDLSTRRVDETGEICKGNNAVAVARTGFFLGLFIALSGLVTSAHNPNTDVGRLAAELALWGLGAVVLMIVSAWVNDKIIVNLIDNQRAITNGNMGVALIEAGTYIGTGFILNGCMSGSSSASLSTTVAATIAFFAISQIVFIAVAKIADMASGDLTTASNNSIPCGISAATRMVCVGIIIRAAVAGDFNGWKAGFVDGGIIAIVGLTLFFFGELIARDVFITVKKADGEECQQKACDLRAQNVAFSMVSSVPSIGLATIIAAAIG